MADLAPGSDYRFPPAPQPARLDRATWNAVMVSLSQRIRSIEAKGAELDGLIADLSFNGQTRIDAAITPLIEQVRRDIVTVQATIEKVVQDAANAATDVTNEVRERVSAIEIDVANVEAAFARILAGGLPAPRVTGLADLARLDGASKVFDFTLGRLPRGASFVRPSAGTHFDDRGVLRTTAAGALRFDHDPLTRESRGALIERQSQNLILHSHDFAAASWNTNASDVTISADAAMALDGSNTADVIGSPTNFRGISLTNPITLTPGSWVVSSIFRLGTTTEHRLRLIYSGGPQLLVGMRANGTLFASGDNVVSFGVVDIGLGVKRLWLAFNLPDGAGYSALRMELTNNSVAGSWTQLHAQLESGAVISSPVFTSGSAATRAADNLSAAVSSDWLNAAEATFFWEGVTGPMPAGGGDTMFSLDSGSLSNYLHLYRASNRRLVALAVIQGTGVLHNAAFTASLPEIADGSLIRVVYSTNRFGARISLNGASSTVTHSVSNGSPAELILSRFTNLRLGHRVTSGLHWTGHQRRFLATPRHLTAAEIEALTRI